MSKKKLYPIKWYKLIQKMDSRDDECEYVTAIYQPDYSYSPCNEKYYKQKSRFIKHERI